MEILIGIALAVVGMLWAFFKGKGSQKKDDLEGEIERQRDRIAEESAQTDEQVAEKEDEVDELDDRLRDNQARDMDSDEAIRILRERHGWDPIDDHAP